MCTFKSSYKFRGCILKSSIQYMRHGNKLHLHVHCIYIHAFSVHVHVHYACSVTYCVFNCMYVRISAVCMPVDDGEECLDRVNGTCILTAPKTKDCGE